MTLGKKPRTPLPRYTALPRTPVRRKPRKPSETLRIYGSKERRAWIKSLPCCMCASISHFFASATEGTSHNAHTVTGGTGRKADADTIVPMCASHHRRYDEHKAPFDNEVARNAVKALAPLYARAWAHLEKQPKHLSAIVPEALASLLETGSADA